MTQKERTRKTGESEEASGQGVLGEDSIHCCHRPWCEQMLFLQQGLRFLCRYRSPLSLEKHRRLSPGSLTSFGNFTVTSCLKIPPCFEHFSPSLGLESHTPEGCQREVYLPVIANPATVEAEPTCEPDTRCNCSQASTPAVCCESPHASANTGHLSHLLPLLLWARLLRKWPH